MSLKLNAPDPNAPTRTPNVKGTRQNSPGLPRLAAWRVPDVRSLLPALFVLIAALALVPLLVSYLRHSWEIINFPWQIDFDEGVNLNASYLLSQGTNIYRPYSADHFVSALYPPIYYVLNAAAVKLWGLNLWSGRLLAMLGALGVGAGIWAWVRLETGKHLAGALAALVWFSLGPVYVWSTFYKQDLPALALGVLGCAMAAPSFTERAKSLQPLHKRLLYLSILPLALSFWTKQSSLAPIASVGLALLMLDWRLALRWGAWAAGAILLPFAAVTLLTKGGFWQHMLAFNSFGRSVARFNQRASALIEWHYPLVLGGVGFLAAFLVMPAVRKKTPPLSAIFLFVSIPATILGILHPTGNYNHLLNILAPLCLALGVAFGRAWSILEKTEGPKLLPWGALALAGLVAVGQLAGQAGKPAWTWYTPLGMPLAERTGQMEKIASAVKQTPGDVYSEDAWMLLHNSKRVLYDDPAGMTALANAGTWDQSVFLSDLQRRKYGLLLLEYDLTNETYNPRWTAQALQAAQANYSIQFRDVLFAHAPKAPEAAPAVPAACAIERGPTLSGYTLRGTTANHGDTLPLSLYWQQGAGNPNPNLKFYVKMVDAGGTSHWGADLVPGQVANKPLTQGWQKGETVRDDLTIPVDRALPYGEYKVLFGAYEAQNGAITPLKAACSVVQTGQAGTLVLGSVQITERWGK